MMKLKKDPNAQQFRRENNGELFQIEVDAMQKDPERFKQLVLSSVDKYYDDKTYERVMHEYTPKDIDDIIRRKIKFLERDDDED
jgi:hypothetical protein